MNGVVMYDPGSPARRVADDATITTRVVASQPALSLKVDGMGNEV